MTTSRNGVHSQVIKDPSVQAAMQPWIEMECYQLSRGEQLSKMECLDFGHQQIVRESQQAAIQKQGVMPANLCTISYCSIDPAFRFSELKLKSDDAVFFMPENTEFDIYVPSGVQTSYISFNQDAFLNGAQTLNPEMWEKAPNQLITINNAQQMVLNDMINHWLKISELNAKKDLFFDQDLIDKMLLQDVLQFTVTNGSKDFQPTRSERNGAFHLCREVRAFIEECFALDMVPTIVEICNVIGVSERTLQYAFRSYVDMPPLAYLRLCRLHRVRTILKASDPHLTTVTAVAMQFGFLHLGRFALEYRQLFNEPPSITLAN